jgi:hypothetical protein
MNSIIPLIKELERIYDVLALKFELKHERPIITIQTKGRQKQTLGWYWDKKWEHNNKEIGEINICAEDLNKNPIETLIHEMVHYSNSCDKIEDCNSQQYHNKAFKTKAESYGLNVEKNGRHGYGLTKLSENLEKQLKEINIDYKVFELFRKQNLTITAPTKMKKFRCECTTIRCAVELKAQCLKCNKEFLLEE